MAEDTLTPEEKERLNRQHMHALKVAYVKRQDHKTQQQQNEKVVEKS
jgi:hypothetical protein